MRGLTKNGQSAVVSYTKFAVGAFKTDIVHINTGQWKLKLMQKLLYGPPFQVLSMFLTAYLGTTLVFGFVYFAFGASCYKFDNADDWGFALCLWISVHVFSTIGFGNVAPTPRCIGPQLFLMLEFFLSLLIVSAISGYVVKQFLKPISAVRFSKNLIVNHGRRRVASIEEARTGVLYRFLTFRMVRQGNVALRDVTMHIQGQWTELGDAYGDRDHHKGRVGTLKLEQDKFTTLEQLQVWHRLDEASPLWPIRDALDKHLDGIEISVSAFDTASLQPVKLFKRYGKGDLVSDVVFVNTFAANPRNAEQLQADHSKLDLLEPEDGDNILQRMPTNKRGCRAKRHSGEGYENPVARNTSQTMVELFGGLLPSAATLSSLTTSVGGGRQDSVRGQKQDSVRGVRAPSRTKRVESCDLLPSALPKGAGGSGGGGGGGGANGSPNGSFKQAGEERRSRSGKERRWSAGDCFARKVASKPNTANLGSLNRV